MPPPLIYRAPPRLLPTRFVRPAGTLAGLGDLGDLTDGSAALRAFRTYLESAICAHAGPAYLQNAKNAPNLLGSINLAATAFIMGEAGTLQPDAQASWNQWRAAASNPSSDNNTAWLFGRMVANGRDQLIAAANSYGSWWSDPTASAASYTLMDTSQTGTTWFGGTVVSSKLSNDQWATIFIQAFAVLLKGASNGVLPLTYLQVLCQGMLQPPVSRRMPVFSPPPGNLAPMDPKAIAFRAAMKQLGWSGVIARWYGFTAQAWAAENSAYESQDASYASVITSLSYVSGEKILEQIQEKVQDYWDARTQAAQALADFQAIVEGPTGDQVSGAEKDAMTALKAQYNTIDQQAFSTLSPVGMWAAGPAGSLSGYDPLTAPLSRLGGLGLMWGRSAAIRRSERGLADLGALQLILAGILAVTALGIIAYVVSLMTKVGRDAAAQTKATAERILATVSDMTSSCKRSYDASAKSPDDEDAYRACLAQTKALTDSIPKPPDASDPLGLKWIALVGAVGAAGLIAWSFVKKKG